METVATPLGLTAAETARSEELFRSQEKAGHVRTDRLFAKLMLFQWVAGMAAAEWLSPKTWMGAESQTNVHVWAAVFLGAAIAGFPIFLASTRPGWVGTRHVIAVGQMLTSALLIHLTGGRIETHFHVFGSLAFLAFYGDWRVLVTATLVTALDHFVRGAFWPQSIFGMKDPSHWRWIEHAGWVLFENTFLYLSIRQKTESMLGLARRQAKLEGVNSHIEREVLERTEELRNEVRGRIEAEEALRESQNEMLEVSRMAGMAEVATAVMHNIGNVLNGVNVSATLVAESVKKGKGSDLGRVVALLDQHSTNLVEFLCHHPRGKQLTLFLRQLDEQLRAEQAHVLTEVASLQEMVRHIAQIVSAQQATTKLGGITESLKVTEVVEDCLRINQASLKRHEVSVIRDYRVDPTISIDRHKVLQILVNLIRNAKTACEEGGKSERLITVSVTEQEAGIEISVCDNGVGIPPENLARIFNHGFTTRDDGHGFGLHSGALAAQELGGSLEVESRGQNDGATFTLKLPVEARKRPSRISRDEPATRHGSAVSSG